MTANPNPVSAVAATSPSWLRRHGGKVILSLVLAGCFVWLLHAGALPMAPPKSSFARLRWESLGVYLGIWCLVHFVRAARWTYLLEPIAKVPLRRILATSFIGFAAIALLPVRTGEAVRPLLIRRKGQLSGWAATGTIAAERILDGLFLSLMLFAGLSVSKPLSPLPDHIGKLPISPSIVPKSAYVALAVFALAFIVMGIFYAQRAWARRMTERIVGAASPRLATWLADKVEHVADGLRFLPRLRYSVPFIVATAVYWLLNGLGNWLLARGVGLDGFTFSQACVLTGVVALGILVPNAPGFFGAYQFSMFAALALYCTTDDVQGPGAAYVLLTYGSQLFITIAGAFVGFLLDSQGVREAFATDSAPDSIAPNLPAETASE
jgi:uncharacterized protein (TIRG00374 family)